MRLEDPATAQEDLVMKYRGVFRIGFWPGSAQVGSLDPHGSCSAAPWIDVVVPEGRDHLVASN